MEADRARGAARIDLETGEFLLRSTDTALDRELDAQLGKDEDADEVRAADPERWLWVENEGSHEGYRDMEAFLDTPIPAAPRSRLERALGGRRGAFRRFRDVLADHPKELAAWRRPDDLSGAAVSRRCSAGAPSRRGRP